MKYEKLLYGVMSGKKRTKTQWAKHLNTNKYYIDKLVEKIKRDTLVDIYSHDGILDVQSVAEKSLECEGLLRKNRILKQDNEALWDRISKEQQKSIWRKVYDRLRKED